MTRRLAACSVVGGAIVALGALMPGAAQTPLPGGPAAGEGKGSSGPARPVVLPAPSAEGAVTNGARQPDPSPPLTIPDSHLVAVDKQYVPSERGGRLLVIGTDLRPGEPPPPADRLVTAELPVLAVELKPEERVADDQVFAVDNGPKKYRIWKEGDPLEPSRLAVARVVRMFRRLEVGDEVKAGQVLGVIDPILVLHELAILKARLEGAEATLAAEEKQCDEYHERWKYDELQYQKDAAAARNVGALEHAAAAKLAYEHHKCLVTSRRQAVCSAERELGKCQAVLKLHEIRSSVPGVVTGIYKNRGDAVYSLESVFEVQNTRSLRLEGWAEAQHLPLLRKGLEVVVEPARPVGPVRVMRGHLQEVSGVAVSQGRKPLVVSAGADRTVRVWDPETGMRLRTLRHPAAVRAVACTPPGGKELCLSGAADGMARLWDLNDPEPRPRELSPAHKGAVTCVAFSPDGRRCATGGEDHAICLWDAETGQRLHSLAGAQDGAVASLQFASPSRLVSAGRDGRLVVWALSQEGPPRKEADFDGLGTAVTALGVSPDGRQAFFDHGPELRLLSLPGGETEAAFRNTTKDLSFSTLALFSPDGRVLLTGGAPEGGLQLWRAPTGARPAGELRRLTWADSPATCGAFAPDGAFVVSGTQDGSVLVWEMPSPEEVVRRLTARVTLVEQVLSASSGQARVWAELNNPGFLTPGGSATMVVAPAR